MNDKILLSFTVNDAHRRARNGCLRSHALGAMHEQGSGNVLILEKKVTPDELLQIEPKVYFDGMVKCVVDIEKEIIAVNAELHADLETYLLEHGSSRKNLYGINILEDGEVEYDSLINPPRNQEAGFPRAGRTVADPAARKKIEEVVEQWMN